MDDVDKEILDLEVKIQAIEKEKSDILLRFEEILDKIGKIEFYHKTAKIVFSGDSGAWRNFIIRGFPHLQKYTGRVDLTIKQNKERNKLAGEIEFKFSDDSPMLVLQTDSLGNIAFTGVDLDAPALAPDDDGFKNVFILKTLQKIWEVESF